MEQQVIVISDGEEEEEEEEEGEGAGGRPPRPKRRRRGSGSPPTDLIDLTEDDSGVSGVQHSDLGVIDLTTLEEVEEMLSSSDSSLNCSSESSHCEDDCLFVKESCVQNSSLPNSSDQISPLPEVKVIYDDMSVDSSSDSSSSDSSSSSSSGCDISDSNHSPSSEHSCISKGGMSDSGTAINSDLGSLDSPDSERPSRTNSSSSRSMHTSLDSLLEDPPDSTSKNSCAASPALRDIWDENICLDHQTASVEISTIASSRNSCCRLSDSSPLNHMRGLCDRRSSLETSSCVTTTMPCERLAVNHSVLSSRKSCDRSPSLENSPYIPSRTFHPLTFTRTCNGKPSVENSPHVTSRELSDSKPSQSNGFHASLKESDHKPTVDNLHHITSSQTFDNKRSVGNSSLWSYSPCADSRPSVENMAQVACSKSNDDQSQGRKSSRVSGKESGDDSVSEENVPHVTSNQPADKTSIGNSYPVYNKELDDSGSSVEEFYKVSNKELENNHLPENTSCASSKEYCDIGSSSENETLSSSCARTTNWSSLEKLPLVCTRSSNSRLETPHLQHKPSSNHITNCNVLHLPQPNTSSQEHRTVKPDVPPITPVLQLFPSPGSQRAPDKAPKAPLGPGLASRAWLNKLKYFRKLPVQHLFFQGLKQDEELCKNQMPVPISNRRMNMVNTTMEEGFAQGTLQFLMDFVSSKHYPKKETVSHVIHNILLGKEDLEILPDAYTVLIKIQQFHPADVSTVGWDWKLLSEVMDAQDAKIPGHLLFLRYALQTLEDDFQKNLVRRTLQKSIAKTMLSCDQHFSNVRDVIRWLTDAVTWCPTEAEASSSQGSWPDATRNQNMMIVCILQQLLSIAVEVDKSPTISSNKMADTMFPFVLSIQQRWQRDTFFNTMTSNLLRGKLLEVMFDHSCERQPAQALSRTKVLYFLEHSTLLLEGKGTDVKSQRWDELLHHIYLLFISYESILFDHLRFPLTERVDLTVRKAKPQLIKADIISKQDVDEHMAAFCRRINRGHEDYPDAQLLERTQVLRTVLYTAVQCAQS